VAARYFDICHGRAAATSRRIAARYPDTIDFDTTLNGADTKRNVVSGFHALRLQHLRRLSLLSLFDFCVLGNAVSVNSQFDQPDKDCQNLG